MVLNGNTLLALAPIEGMVEDKCFENGVSFGLGEAGYDIRIKQGISFWRNPEWQVARTTRTDEVQSVESYSGKFIIASSVERFRMPKSIMGIVHDKSSWARRGLSVFNTVIEPGWEGYLTLELVYHGQESLHIPAGAGIAQVVFHEVSNQAKYKGRYQNQKDEPVPAIRA